MKRKHQENQSGVCPECGSESLLYIRRIMEGGRFLLRYGEQWKCESCKAEGVEWYTLDFDKHETTRRKESS